LQAAALELQGFGGTVGKIDDSTGHHRTAIVDLHYYGSMVSQIRYLHHGPERKRRVSRGQVVHIEGFTAGSLFAIEIVSVPRGRTYLVGLARRFRNTRRARFTAGRGVGG